MKINHVFVAWNSLFVDVDRIAPDRPVVVASDLFDVTYIDGPPMELKKVNLDGVRVGGDETGPLP
jgi:hypothetical protein